MSWNNLKSGIAAIIKTNDNQEITGANLQNVLNTIVNSIGAYPLFAGVANAETNPGTPDGPVFYVAVDSDRYSNFGNLNFDNESGNYIGFFIWNGESWSLERLLIPGLVGAVRADITQNFTEVEKRRARLNIGVTGSGGGGGGGGADSETVDELVRLTSLQDVNGSTLDVYGSVDVRDNMTVGANAEIDGDAEIHGDLDVWGAVTFEEAVAMLNDVTLADNCDIYLTNGQQVVQVLATLIQLLTKTGKLSVSNNGQLIIGNSTQLSGDVVRMNADLVFEANRGIQFLDGGIEDSAFVFTDYLEAGEIVLGNANLSDILSAYSQLLNKIKSALGPEISDTAPRNIRAGEVIWHDNNVYRVINPIQKDSAFNLQDVVETTFSDEINSLRGVAVESVVLTITPISAIPTNGIKARLYNVTTDTYLPEVTITPEFNRALLGVINYGDVYTIIMPEIEGYTKPGDQTFIASQMMRERTVDYVASQSNIEHLTIMATCSDGAAIGDYDVTVQVLDGQGAVSATYLLPIEGGTSQSVDIPYGSNYTVTFPNISGYLTPRIVNTTAKASNRVLKAKYVLVAGTALQWVVKNEETGEFDYYNTDYDMTGKTIFGMAVLDSTLLANNSAFIIRTNTSVTTTKAWTNPKVDVPSATDLYNGESNTVNVLQAISDYEAEHSGTTVQSLFKDVDATNSGVTVDGISVKYFMAAPYQARYILLNASVINNLWQYYNAGNNLITSISPAQTSAQYNADTKYAVNSSGTIYQGYVKTMADYGYYRVLPIITVFDITT